ncbi:MULTISPECIES: hypothetical protein [unclassified Rhizobium]|uniref:hypothetical protein n=1 Tax=unclassified Rhizobium TaxID=2613769 RepID=UPI001AE9C494|nr:MULTISPECIES: hypothetical protein [unclassified Rhizobium]MBP2461447.1 hypothetical protein [Rhizobium sp. PvP014]MBP2528843.1 hypothetical protein [Rhizobium sp. PvP099]
MIDAEITEAFVGLCCFEPCHRISFHRSTIPVIRGVEIAYLFVANSQPFFQIARIE